MFGISSSSNRSNGLFGAQSIRFRDGGLNSRSTDNPSRGNLASFSTLRQIHQLRLAIQALKPGRLSTIGTSRQAGISQPASALSASPINFSSSAATFIKSTSEVNTAPTSFSMFGPNWVGSTVTAPWSGPGSTADATVGGLYDGSNGSGTLTFNVRRAGTHGVDDLRIKVYAPDGSFIENIDIGKNDPINQLYQLSNGLEITLSAGELVKNEYFEVDTQLLNTSFTPNQSVWNGSTALPTIGGTYDGSNGTGQLTFRATRNGTHGVDDLKVKVYAPDQSFIETISIKKNDPINKVYNLSNGLTFALSAGALIKNETFLVNVDATDPSATGPTQPQWQLSTALVDIGGTYDGSNGSGALTVEVTRGGVHGQDDLRLKVFDPDNNVLQNINIDASDPISQVYNLNNGLTFTLGAGELIKNETFTFDVQAAATFSTQPNPVESTALITVGGIYDGSNLTGTLTFQVTQGGTHGIDDLQLQLFGPNSSLLETIDVASTDPINQTYQLANGLTFSLGSGDLGLNETFTIDVNHQIGSSINPDNPFSGVRNASPNLDPGFTVSDGSFQINGITINVDASDSLNQVLDRINNSAADVTASYDVAGDMVVLTRNTAGASHTIELSNDTSGFLAATKLAGASPVIPSGNASTPIGELASFGAVSSGSILLNGVSVAIDVDTDSLDDIIARINASAAGVTAGIQPTENLFSITANQSNEDMVISSNSTGFFAALGINDGTYESIEIKGNQMQRRGFAADIRNDVIDAVKNFASRINDVFDESDASRHADPYLREIRGAIRSAIANRFESNESKLKTEFGIKFDMSNRDAEPFVSVGDRERTGFLSQISSANGATAYQEFFFGRSDSGRALADELIATLKDAETDLITQLGPSGHVIDILA